MAISGIGVTPVLPGARLVAPLGQPEPVQQFVPGRTDPSRRPLALQPRPEHALVMLMAQRPGQLRRLFEAMGGAGATLDVEAAVAELEGHMAGGGSLAAFGAARGLDFPTRYLLAVQARLALRTRSLRLGHQLEREMDEVLTEHGVEIDAALNTSRAMRSLAGSSSDRVWMRSLYLAAVTVRSPISETFESLLQRFGPQGFERGAATLLRALSDDLAANRSSVTPDRLQGVLLASLVSMRHVLGLIHTSQGFLRNHGIAPPILRDGEAAADGASSGAGSGASSEAGSEASSEAGSNGDRDADRDAEQRGRAERLTVQLVKLLLQLAGNASAAQSVPPFLNHELGAGMAETELLRLRHEFIRLVNELPVSLWKEPSFKDHLLDGLRRQHAGELAHRALKSINEA